MKILPTVRSRVARASTLKSLLSAVLCLAAFVPLPSSATVVPTHEVEMDWIFADPDFGTGTIDIRFNTQIDIIDDVIFDIDDEASWDSLGATTLGLAGNVVRMFFVDSISWCGDTNAGYIGCSNIGDNDIAIELGETTKARADELYAHELGHSLGLADHSTLSGNLMRAKIVDGNIDLTPDQILDINLNLAGLIQTDAFGRFIEIAPILVSASIVSTPLPGGLILCLSALGTLAARRGFGRRTAA